MGATETGDWSVSPTELLEQAYHLLRRLRPVELAPCLIGPLPFVGGLMFFWSDMTRGADTASAALWAFGLAVLYGWMKAWQAVFARRVWARLLPAGGLPSLSALSLVRRFAALWILNAFAVPILVLTANLMVPFAWAYAFFQNTSVLALTADCDRRSLRSLAALSFRQAFVEPLSNHLVLALLIFFALLVWLGVFATAALIPMLAKSFSGIENEFTRNPTAGYLNSLFLAATVAATWLLVGPFFRVVYVLRNFYALSRSTGADLLSRLHAFRLPLGALLVALAMAASPARAQDGSANPAPPADPREQSFSDSLRRTLAQREFQWRLPPDEAGAEKAEEGMATSILRRIRTAVRDVFESVDSAIRRLWERMFGEPSSTPEGSGGGVSPSAVRGLIMVLGGILLIVIVTAVVHLLRRKPVPAAPAPEVNRSVDLDDEATLASELPQDVWLNLARDKIAAGDIRLAVRALFLATLATLGEQRLVEIARSKSNLDYRNELLVRSRARPEIHDAFGENVGLFERIWYGLHEAGRGTIDTLMANFERIRRAPDL